MKTAEEVRREEELTRDFVAKFHDGGFAVRKIQRAPEPLRRVLYLRATELSVECPNGFGTEEHFDGTCLHKWGGEPTQHQQDFLTLLVRAHRLHLLR